MRLIRLLITLAILGGLVFLGVTVPLGGKTLWEHIKAIAGSKESKELVEGVKQKAEQIAVRADGGRTGGDKLTDVERKLLRKLIREKLGGSIPERPKGARGPELGETKGPPPKQPQPKPQPEQE